MIENTVIIGHGPSLYNKGRGEFIDSFKYVIRFPSDDWQTQADYGKRTSFYCSANRKAKLLTGSPEHGYYLWSKYNGRKAGKRKNMIDVSELIQSWQARLPKGAYPFLSHGAAGICIAASELKKPITVLGCDALKNGEPDPKKYISGWVHTNHPQKKMCHSFDCERKLIDEVAKEYDVRIQFI
jgi:hypothetical protein